MKVIIWGYPLGSDTLSYVWHGFFKTFQVLGHDVQWFHDGSYPHPDSFDYNNCLFLAEQYQCTNMPLLDTSTYLIHTLTKPERFLNRVKRLIDLRYSCDFQEHPVNYNYVMDRFKLQHVGPLAYYDKTGICEKLYLAWATDLLPCEIDMQDRFAERNKTSYFIGTLYDGEYENKSVLNRWISACKDYGIEHIHIDPWTNPVSVEKNRHLVKSAYLAPDLRGPQNIKCGYMPCRIFKNISYGQLGLTNALHVHQALNYCTIYHPDPYRLFELGQENMKDYDRILYQMQEVATNHTYINRVQSILDIL